MAIEWMLSVLLAAGPAAAAEMSQDAAAPAAQAGPATQEGAMRLVIAGMGEWRVRFPEPPRGDMQKSLMQVQFKLRGADMKKIARIGDVILTEAVDDTGKTLLDPNQYSEEQRKSTRVIEVNDAMVNDGGVPFLAQLMATARGSKTIKTLKGYVNVAYAGPVEEIVVGNPLKYKDGTIDHPRLKELGVTIRVIAPGAESVPADNKSIGLMITEGKDKVQGTEFHDEWMRRTPERTRPSKTEKGEEFITYQLQSGQFGDSTELVLKVFTDLRTEQVMIDMKDVELP